MAFSKKVRENVYQKYGGHCAYCGCELQYKDMQVDHIIPQYEQIYKKEAVINDLNNLNPSCRACNFYKGTKTLDRFRNDITELLIPNLKKNFNFKLAKKYGFVTENESDSLTFYFEKQKG